MTINAITNSTSAAPTTSTSNNPISNTTLDRQAFLKLLVAQLRYQDPSKPMDASAMISQSAQLSVVDKLDDISKQLTTSGVTDQLMLAGYVVGKSVSFNAADGSLVTETVSAAHMVGGSVVLKAGAWDVPLSAVTAILPASTPAPAA